MTRVSSTWIRSKVGISLEIIVSVFKCFIVSHDPLHVEEVLFSFFVFVNFSMFFIASVSMIASFFSCVLVFLSVYYGFVFCILVPDTSSQVERLES